MITGRGRRSENRKAATVNYVKKEEEEERK